MVSPPTVRVASVTSSVAVLLVTLWNLAEMTVFPSLKAVASPTRSMVATLLSELSQST
ncbi:hypothetical protein D3C76_1753090 [compost metagenome]